MYASPDTSRLTKFCIVQFVVIDAMTGIPREFTVEGTTFSPHGSVTSAAGKADPADLQSDPVQRLAEISAVCNDSKIVYNAVSNHLSYSCVVTHTDI